jgi:hypothetical protein
MIAIQKAKHRELTLKSMNSSKILIYSSNHHLKKIIAKAA